MAHTQHPPQGLLMRPKGQNTHRVGVVTQWRMSFFVTHTCTCENSVVFLTGTTIKTSLQLAESSGSSCQRRRPEIKEMTCKAREATHMAKKKKKKNQHNDIKNCMQRSKNNDQNKIRLRQGVFLRDSELLAVEPVVRGKQCPKGKKTWS